MSERLRAWMFRCDRDGRGFSQILCFYAETARQATAYAKAWASERGYVVEIVRDEEVAS